MRRYTKQIQVVETDLDELNHVNNIRYLEWVLQIAGEHWATLTRPDWEASFIWVVKSHHISYFRSAVKNDALELETYVDQARGALSHRVVEIRLAGTDTRVATCKTEWCLLDKSRLKPVRMPEAMLQAF
ncbi:thioesterase family protein [Robiginitalea sp. SC105]|uniref:acyl-CoA thioesterase n=1 Tax=Robiginitalea sp. SC105 TaxID=2762332 RepID=UPI00163A3582|nr:acyl-CoA thioesterase [Robiginitalea sp. SC105]MBC2840734.1 acyl-CoA thioesterase [Robiginitalea sp. SC105]